MHHCLSVRALPPVSARGTSCGLPVCIDRRELGCVSSGVGAVRRPGWADSSVHRAAWCSVETSLSQEGPASALVARLPSHGSGERTGLLMSFCVHAPDLVTRLKRALMNYHQPFIEHLLYVRHYWTSLSTFKYCIIYSLKQEPPLVSTVQMWKLRHG